MILLKVFGLAWAGVMVGLLTFQVIRIDEGMSMGAYLGGSSWGFLFMLMLLFAIEGGKR